MRKAAWAVGIIAIVILGFELVEVAERIFGWPDRSACAPDETLQSCLREWLNVFGVLGIGALTLLVLIRQTNISDQQMALTEHQRKSSLARQLVDELTQKLTQT
jgi:hypothetical protein